MSEPPDDDRRQRRRNVRALAFALSLVGLAWVLFGLAVWWTEREEAPAVSSP
jgi:hypothetical protein